jgi:hypothetical protein
MALSITENRQSILKAYQKVANGPCDSWVLYSYIPGSKDELEVVSEGDEGLEELEQEFQCHRIMYALVKVQDPKTTLPKMAYINWQGESVSGLIRGVAAGHVSDFPNHFKGINLTIHARNEDDVDPELIMAEITRASATSYNFKNRPQSMSEDVSNLAPVGTNYTPIKPQSAIAPADERQKFWARQQQDERERKVQEDKSRKEKEKRAQEELKQKEIESQKRRNKEVKSRALKIAQLEKPQDRESINTGPIVTMTDIQNKSNNSSMNSNISNRTKNTTNTYGIGRSPINSTNNMQSSYNQNNHVNNLSSKFEQNSNTSSISPGNISNKGGNNTNNNSDSAYSSNLSTTNSNSHASNISSSGGILGLHQNSNNNHTNQINSGNINTSNNLNFGERLALQNQHNTNTMKSNTSSTTTISTHASASNPNKSNTSISPRSNTNYSANPFKASGMNNVVKHVEPVQVQVSASINNNVAKQSNSYVSPMMQQEVVSPQYVESVEVVSPVSNTSQTVKAKALYDYDADDDTEISFLPGDIITEIDQFDEGWWTGRAPDGKVGMFPANYVELC